MSNFINIFAYIFIAINWFFNSQLVLLLITYNYFSKITDEKEVLPNWVQDLLTCCCFVNCFPIQSAAMATILDLILLTQSVQNETKNKNPASSNGTVSVLIVPVLLPRNLQYINTNTLVYQVNNKTSSLSVGLE